jgi:hypothetical protein
MAAQTGIGSFAPATSGTAVINNILTQEANRIGSDIYSQTLHTSPWMDLLKKSAFPSDMGYQLNTIVYDRSLPLRDNGTAGLDDPTVIGVNWTNLGTAEAGAGSQRTGFLPTPATKDGIGPQTGKSVIDFNRQLKSYSLARSVIESPRINIEDLRFAAHRQEQLRAIMDILKESTRFSWEERYRDEYDRLCANILICKATGSASAAKSESLNTFSVYDSASTNLSRGINGSPVADSTANISNKVLDGLYFKLVRAGAGTKAYGRENGRPVFGLVLSSEASYVLQTEAGFRDDVRYNASKVSDLIAPLGIEKSFRGFYHLVDDLAPRFSFSATTGVGSTTEYTRIQPYTFSSTTSVIIPNTTYDAASYEAAYVLHEEVMEVLIPEPVSGSNGLQFNPINYRGDFRWTNILSELTNPDGTIGLFRGILASASKPIKTNFGYAIIFKRDSTTPAA